MTKIVTYCFMNTLPDEIILKIASHLDAFQQFQLSHTSIKFQKLIYNKPLHDTISSYFIQLSITKKLAMKFIKRINSDGVVNGECEQCHAESLLYTQFDGINERCICLGDCVAYCNRCDVITRFHNTSLCPLCRTPLLQID
ncbi:hypothetical protein QKU58_gp032 [Pyramimonas orientalis virus]|uniref:F-box domain-containing protein n=1 Tax=Pyramimonas orientalis virus 01B TaxID=3134525 RepID=A0A7L9AXK0_9VIRU|nr:hypothetical protein QKU58_gp032 [Pyramimonas orientalis virus]QOI90299.1 hypothetical protein HWQ62_00162 [Pyramimonas orientalis virus]